MSKVLKLEAKLDGSGYIKSEFAEEVLWGALREIVLNSNNLNSEHGIDLHKRGTIDRVGRMWIEADSVGEARYRKANFLDTVHANIDNDKMNDLQFRELVRHSLELFYPTETPQEEK